MAKNVSVKIEGLDELYKKIGDLAEAIGAEKSVPFRLEAAEVIVSDAKSRVKVDSGLLRDSIVAKALPKGGVIAAVDRKKAPHAHLIEFGTSRAQAYPFFRPAVDGQGAKVLEIMKKGYEGLIRGVAK